MSLREETKEEFHESHFIGRGQARRETGHAWILGAAMLAYGAWRCETATVLSKAIRICLEAWALDKKEKELRKPRPFPAFSPGSGASAGLRRTADHPHLPNLEGQIAGKGQDRLRAASTALLSAATGACPTGICSKIGSSQFKFLLEYVTSTLILLKAGRLWFAPSGFRS